MMLNVNVKMAFESTPFEWDENETAISNVHTFIKSFLDITDPHNRIHNRVYEHTMRSIKISERIMKKELADREIVIISLLLHDIGKPLCDDSHNLVSYSVAELLLNKYSFDEVKKKRILDCILYHSAKNLQTLDLSMEQKVVMDADIVDEIGLLLIAKICLRTANRNCSIHEIIKSLEYKYERIEKESKLLKTTTGNDLYIQKKKKLKEYIENLKLESMEFSLR